jgi:hypothetical protein
MKIKSVRESDSFTKKFNEYDPTKQAEINRAKHKLAWAITQAENPAKLPQTLNKPSKTKPFRRAKIDKNLRLYWWIDGQILVLHDICNHPQAKAYGDVHKKY